MTGWTVGGWSGAWLGVSLALAPGMAWGAAPVAGSDGGQVVLSAEVDRVWAKIRDLRPETCTDALEPEFVNLERLRPDEVDLADVAANGPATVRGVFRARLLLQQQLRVMVDDGTLTADCMRSLRRIDLAGRYLADYLLGALDARGSAELAWLSDARLPFHGPDDLRTGDVLVTRGSAVSSAGIAHMGRVDSQFSHNALVYVDPRSGKRWVIEAYLELGAVVEPLDRFLEHGIDRIVVMRHPDTALAALAAETAFERVKHGPRIDYDADFDFGDHHGLFCSEVPGWAFGSLIGRPDDVPIPMALTEFARDRNPSMFAAMGIEGGVTSAPPDLMFDPRFDVIAEWRDLADLVKLRHQDAAVESVMAWMEDKGYTLAPKARHRSTVGFGLFVRKIPLLGLALKHKIHPHGDRDFLVASLALQEVALAVFHDLEVALAGAAEPLTYDDMRSVLEQLRVDDLARYRSAPNTARYHGILVPPPG